MLRKGNYTVPRGEFQVSCTFAHPRRHCALVHTTARKICYFAKRFANGVAIVPANSKEKFTRGGVSRRNSPIFRTHDTFECITWAICNLIVKSKSFSWILNILYFIFYEIYCISYLWMYYIFMYIFEQWLYFYIYIIFFSTMTILYEAC